MLAIECSNYYEPEEIAKTIAGICDKFAPNGYRMDEYDGRKRLEVIASMVDALRDETPAAMRAQLTHTETFAGVYEVLEWSNCHTENLALQLAFGDSDAVFDALGAVHHMGQCFALYGGLKRPELIH